MHIMVLINNRSLMALLDSGFTHDFIDESVVHQALYLSSHEQTFG